MHTQNMVRDRAVAALVNVISDDEQEVETGQKRVGQRDVLVRILVDVVLGSAAAGGQIGVHVPHVQTQVSLPARIWDSPRPRRCSGR